MAKLSPKDQIILSMSEIGDIDSVIYTINRARKIMKDPILVVEDRIAGYNTYSALVLKEKFYEKL